MATGSVMEWQATRAGGGQQGRGGERPLGGARVPLHRRVVTPPLPDRAALRVSPSALALVAANLVPLAGVLFLGWSVFATLLLFWLENVIVGGFNVLRMAWARPHNPALWAGKLFLIPFFIIHYGMFVTVHGIFVLAFFGGVGAGALSGGFPGPATFLHAVQGAGITLAALALVASHGFSFLFNYLGAGEYRTVPLEALMRGPYGRVVVLHLVILGGGFLVMTLGSPLVPLALLVVLKTGLDLVAHTREHKGAAASAETASPSAR